MSLISLINKKNLGVIDEELEWNSIEELAAIISTHQWAPGVFKGRRRLIFHLSRIDLLVLDVDHGCTLAAALETFKPYRHIIATSRNHQKEKGGVTCDRFRVVLFLSETLSTDGDFKATWERARRLFPFIDEQCKDSSRFFFASPEVVSINRTGINFEVNPASVPAKASGEPMAKADSRSSEAVGTRRVGTVAEGTPLLTQPKGELWKSTLKFLLEGAPAGHRHAELIKAVGNMREQNYSHAEVLTLLEEMTERGDWTQPGLSRIDRRTIERMFNREMKYEYQSKPPLDSSESENISPAIIVNAADLLDETFTYLGDKDKVKGEPTGIDGLDKLLGGGFRTGELTVLMAQAKTGKNTLYHHLIYKHLERGIPFGYASRELNPATEVIPNLLSIAMSKNAWTASLDSTYQNDARQVINKWELYFAPGYGEWDLDGIKAWFAALKDQGVQHFLFDHFHYALASEDHESTTRLIKGLKALTKELDIHLSLIVQPRGLREGEQLSLATLRGGSSVGQALDNLLILERVRNENNISKLTLEVARHKLATLGHIFLSYDKETTGFVEVDRQLVSENPIPQGISRRPWQGLRV